MNEVTTPLLNKLTSGIGRWTSEREREREREREKESDKTTVVVTGGATGILLTSVQPKRRAPTPPWVAAACEAASLSLSLYLSIALLLSTSYFLPSLYISVFFVDTPRVARCPVLVTHRVVFSYRFSCATRRRLISPRTIMSSNHGNNEREKKNKNGKASALVSYKHAK